jgi:hypothetical protein
MSAARYDVRYRVLGQKPRVRIWRGSSGDFGLMAGRPLVSPGHNVVLHARKCGTQALTSCLEAVVADDLEIIRLR